MRHKTETEKKNWVIIKGVNAKPILTCRKGLLIKWPGFHVKYHDYIRIEFYESPICDASQDKSKASSAAWGHVAAI